MGPKFFEKKFNSAGPNSGRIIDNSLAKKTSKVAESRTITNFDRLRQNHLGTHIFCLHDDEIIYDKNLGCVVKNHSLSYNNAIRPLALNDSRSRLRLKLYPATKQVFSENLKEWSNEIVVETFINRYQKIRGKSDNLENSSYKVDILTSCAKIKSSKCPSDCNSYGPGIGNVSSTIQTSSICDGNSKSLLGVMDLCTVLPDKEVTIFVGTWNMNGQSAPKPMNDFVLPACIGKVPDIIAIGTQESCADRFDWEVTIQETLGPTHVLFFSTSLGTIHLAIYIRRDLIWYCSTPEDASMSVRTGSAFRTKGAVAISFCLFGTSMLFVTSHLTAHQKKVKERVSDVKRIIHALDLPKNIELRHKSKDVTQNFDIVFWCGDLNFRLSEPREKVLNWIQNTKFPLPSHLPHGYMHLDQLSSVLSDGAAFKGFIEANITFPPTYKYDPGTQKFDTSSKQRTPAYTDRILYKFKQSHDISTPLQNNSSSLRNDNSFVQCLCYDSVPSIITSDHKPVWALFKTKIRAGNDTIPLAGGLFSRDIYLEGIKRRLNKQRAASSVFCSIQ